MPDRQAAAPKPWRYALLLFVALALAWQGFVAGTHIHPPRDGLSAVTAAASQHVAKPAKGEHKLPDEPACPLCEAIAVGGAYVSPDLAPLPVAIAVAPVAFYFASGKWLPPDRLTSHAWRSRAPPHSN